MKNQYFGDINDYKKYGLLRSIITATKFRVFVAWMLTPDDGGLDGQFTAYIDEPGKYRDHDPILFDGLKRFLTESKERHVGLIETTDLVPGAVYFSKITPDSASQRAEWFASLLDCLSESDLVFLDPDNGLEVKSTPYGRKSSSKFLYWREVKEIWSVGQSLLIYQHFIREKRPQFIQRMLEAFHTATPGSLVEAFSTANVVFLMALQPGHQRFNGVILDAVQARWQGRIRHWDLDQGT
ncbi:MAG: hypothetical protein OEU36_16140 [Gammaproteobacteria bacterium]|nr:hypothetical protein [Gammaproteobacteria bacterium]